mgnify:CR=1 FL=1
MLAEQLGVLLTERGWTVAVAESCTGGLISDMITDVPGASHYLLAGLVTYSNVSKIDFLGVRSDTLMQFGAVSERVAREMAVGVRESTEADLGISTTGIAGPGGGSAEKPVGLVHFGVSLDDRVITDHRVFPGYRTRVKREAARYALQMAIDAMKG